MKVKTLVKFNDLVENTTREIDEVFEINDQERLDKLLGLGYVEILDLEPSDDQEPPQEPQDDGKSENDGEPEGEKEPSEGEDDGKQEPPQEPQKEKKSKK